MRMDGWSPRRTLIVAFFVGFGGLLLAQGLGKVFYYVKVVRTVERVLKAQHVEFEF